MRSKVEEVARAIYEGRNGTCCKAWTHLPKAHREPYRLDALNAIHEMREPTPEMIAAAHAVPSGHACDHWCAMIDEAVRDEH